MYLYPCQQGTISVARRYSTLHSEHLLLWASATYHALKGVVIALLFCEVSNDFGGLTLG
jgi:uncharacterized membrane protein YagU involved in acid resistance